jgi:hypothetical protein
MVIRRFAFGSGEARHAVHGAHIVAF